MITTLQLKNAGFNDDQITYWVDQQRPFLKKAGFSDMEINKHYGLRINKSNDLGHITADNDMSMSMNINAEKTDTNLKIIENQKVTEDKDKVIEKHNLNIDKNIAKKNEYLKLNKNDQANINAMIANAYDTFKDDEEGRKSYIENYLVQFYPQLVKEELHGNNDLNLVESSINDKHDSIMEDIEARDILEGKVGYNSETQKYLFSGEFREQEEKLKIKKTAEKLEKKIQKERFKILDPWWTTGKESSNILKYMAEYYGWNEQQINNFNNFISMVATIESDNRRIYSQDGEAKGLWQFRDSSMKTALQRFINLNLKIDDSWKTPQWVLDAFEHLDATAIPYVDQEKALVIANFFMMARNETLNRDGTDELIKKIANFDIDAMKYLYKAYHHADWRKRAVGPAGQETEWYLHDNPKLNARIDEYFDHFNDEIGIGFTNPQLATIPSDWTFDEGLLGKADAWLSYYAGGQGKANVFTEGYKQSVTGLMDQYFEWTMENPDADDRTKEQKMKELFMYSQGQTFSDDIVKMAVQLLNDSPYMIGGCFAASGVALAGTGGAAAPALPAVCMGGAFAVPETLRHAFSEGLMDGKWNNFSEFWEHFMSAKTAEIGAKTFTLGAVTGTAGKISQVGAKKLNLSQKWQTGSRLTAEIYVMTELGARMEGHAPTMRDFATTAVLIFGFHATVGQVTNLVNLYKEHSIHPKDLQKIAEKNPEVKDQLSRGEKPEFIDAHQNALYKNAEKIKDIKLLPEPKFKLNEKINIGPEGSQKGIIIAKELIGNEPMLVVKTVEGTTVVIKESNARKTDLVQDIIVELKADGKLEIKEKTGSEVTTGSKDGKVSFEAKRNNNEYSKEILEIEIKNEQIGNKDGTKYEFKIENALEETNPVKRNIDGGGKIVSKDGKATISEDVFISNKYYPKTKEALNKWETRTDIKPKNSAEAVETYFGEIKNTGSKIDIIYALKRGEQVTKDTYIAKHKGDIIEIPRKIYETLKKFTDIDGKVKQAEVLLSGENLLFINPASKKVIGIVKVNKASKTSKTYQEAESYYNEFFNKETGNNFNYNQRTRSSEDVGIPNDPYAGKEPPKRFEEGWKKLFDSSTALDYFSLVSLVEGLLGKLPSLKNLNNAKYIGVFRHLKEQDMNQPISKQADLIVKRALQNNPAEFLKTLAHELGHLIDFVPHRSTRRGNILGHIAGFKRYLNKWIAGKNDGAKPLSPKEIKAMKVEAEAIAKKMEKEIDAEIKTNLKITPEKILDIFRDSKIRDKIDPEFYEAFIKLDSALKKLVVKDAMKGLINTHIKALVDKANGKRVDPKLSEEAAKVFKEMFEKEIAQRGLVSREMIMKELKNLTYEWHPWDRATAPKKYNAYRDSPAELMAEFMMALLLQPRWVKFHAPKSYDLLMYHMANRPEVKALYTKIQHALNGNKNEMWNSRATEIKDTWVDLELKARDKVTKRKEALETTLRDDLGKEVVDSFWWILDRLKLETQRGNSPLAKDVKYYIENNRYIMAEMSAYKREINTKILKKLQQLNYTKYDLSWMLLLENLAKSMQRSGKITWKFYPLPKDAKTGEILPQFKELQKYTGNYETLFKTEVQNKPELYKVAQEFFELRQRNIVSRVLEMDVFSQEVKADIAKNYYYLTFSPFERVMKKLDLHGAGGFNNKAIKETIGSFQEFMAPFDITVAKDLAMLSHLKRQNTIHHIVEFMKINKSKLERHKAKNEEPVPVLNIPKKIGKDKIDPNIPAGMKRISYQYNGKVKTVDINSNLYEALARNPLYTSKTFKFGSYVNSIFRGLLTEYNALFWLWNWGFRDMRRSFILLPNGKMLKSPVTRLQYVKEVIKGLVPAFKSVYGEGTAVTRHMEKNGYLIALEEGYRSDAGMKRSRLEMDTESFALKELIVKEYENKGTFNKMWDASIGKLIKDYANLGRVLERSHKIGGFEVIKDQVRKGELNMSDKEIMQFVQSKIGSPNFLRQGTMNPLYNNLFLFFNANKEGYRSEWSAFKNDKSGVGSRFLLYSFLPKTVEKLAILGFFGAGMKALYEAVPDYDRHNFNVWVLGEAEGPDGEGTGRPVYIRIPLDFTSQLFMSLYSMGWDWTFGIKPDDTDKFAKFWGAVSMGGPNVTPFVTMTTDIINTIMGEKVETKWGSPAFDDTIMNMDLFEANGAKAKESLKYLWNTYGGAFNMIHKFKMKFKDDIAQELTDLTGLPFIDPVIKRFLKVGNNPVMSKYYDYKGIEKKLENSMQYHAKMAIMKMSEGNYDFTQDEQDALVLTGDGLKNNTFFLEMLVNQSGGSELINEWITGNKKERLMILQAIKNAYNINPELKINLKKPDKLKLKKKEE